MRYKYKTTFTLRAGEYEVFAKRAFDNTIGQSYPWTFRINEGGPVVAVLGWATVLDVEVAEDGKSALYTVEIEQKS